MNFKKVEIDGELSEFEAEELRSLLTEFAEAQEANQDTFDDVTETVEEFNEHDSKLTEKVVEHSSLSEPAAEALDYSDKRSLLDDLDAVESDEEAEDFDENPEEEEEQEFEDRGQKGETHGDNGTPEFVEDAVADISGIQ